MTIKDYIRDLFFAMLIINTALFTFLLMRKIIYKAIEKRKNKIRLVYEREVLNYIATGELGMLSEKLYFLKKRVLKEILTDYIGLLKNDKKKDLIELLDREKTIADIRKKLKSKNRWARRIGAYEAGEFNISEVARELIDLIDGDDRQQTYIASSALLKVGGHSYICRVLNRCLYEEMIEKSSMMYLIGTIEEDIEGILLNLMDKDSLYLKSIALEACGKRHYSGAIPWIAESLGEPDKELRISALKGALYFKDFPYGDYLEEFFRLKDDAEWEVRLFLAKNLKHIDGMKSIEVLKKLMGDKDWSVRSGSGQSLLQKGEKGIAALVDMLDSKDRFAREKAREIIQREMLQNGLLLSLKSEDKGLAMRISEKMGVTIMEEIGKYE
jgi:HEAT repeat protein